MDFSEASHFFGGSIFPDDYRTDFQNIEDRLQEFAKESPHSHTFERQAALLMLRGIGDAMRGEIANAERHLEDLYNLTEEAGDKRWQHRCFNLQYYVLLLQRVPPYLRFRPDSNNNSGILKERGWAMFERRKELQEQRQIVSNMGWSALEKLESDIIINLSRFFDNLWTAAYYSHPEYPHNPLTPQTTKEMFVMLFQSTDPWPEADIRAAQNLGLDETARYLKRLRLEFSMGGVSPDSRTNLDALFKSCLEENDIIEAANCKLLLGDNIASLPFTNPMSLNLMALDRDLGWDNGEWDLTEGRMPLRKSEEADAQYRIAFDLFNKGTSKRGQGAVHLRWGSIDHAEALALSRAGQQLDAVALKESAESHFKEAGRLFKSDSTNSYVVRTHILLLKISTGAHTNILDEASAIGNWGATSRNPAATQFMGLLILRFGRMLYLGSQRSAADQFKAILCCSCARAVFIALKDPLLELHAIVAHSLLLHNTGDAKLASALLIEGKTVFADAVERMTKVMNTIPTENGAHEVLDYLILNRSIDFRQACQTVLGTTDIKVHTLEGSSKMAKVGKILQEYYEKDDHIKLTFQEVLDTRRKTLLQHADMDAAENHLRDFLQDLEELDELPTSRQMLSSMKVIILHYLGEYETARKFLPQAIPDIYGGQDQSSQMQLEMQSLVKDSKRDSESQLAEQAVAMCFIAKDWELGRIVLEQVRARLPSFPQEATPVDNYHWQTLTWVACIEEHSGHWAEAFDSYSEALEMIENRRRGAKDSDTRRDILSTIHSGDLFSGLARVSWQFSLDKDLANDRKPHAQTWQDQMLLYLEQGRARAVLDMLTIDSRTDGEQQVKMKDLATCMAQLRDLGESSKMRPEQRVPLVERLATDLGVKADLATIRTKLEQLSFGLTSVWDESDFATSADALYHCIAPNAACVHINITRDGLLLLFVTSVGIHHIHAGDATDHEIERTVLCFLKLFQEKGQPALDVYMPLLEKISQWVIEPAKDLIRDKEAIIFVPSRSFHKFPFSALLLDGKPLFLDKEVSQAPSLTSLSYLVKKATTQDQPVVCVVTKPDGGIGEDHEEPLPMAGMEAVSISQIHGCVAKHASLLSIEDFGTLYESSNIVHIATHGFQKAGSPWESSISLRESFRVHDLAKLRSHAEVVIFAACVSGLGADTIGNDMLGFSHAVIASGASCYIGGLWDVDDCATMLLMIFFHRQLANRKQETTLAACWREAQLKLYSLSKCSAKEAFEELVKGWDKADGHGQVPDELSRQSRDSLEDFITDLEDEELDYTYVRFWAPFVLVGYGGLCKK